MCTRNSIDLDELDKMYRKEMGNFFLKALLN
jgi:hypothetical protein